MRFAHLRGPDGASSFARVDGRLAFPLAAAPWDLPAEAAASREFADADLLCPVSPTKIVCVGRNYVEHARELANEVPAEPLLFLKPPSALLASSGVIQLPPESSRVEYEAELGVVIGRKARNVPIERAMDHVFGFLCVCDVTARDLQRKDGQWTRAKGFDTFCPVGPFVDTVLDLATARISCRVNGELKQSGQTSEMVFSVPRLISYVSRVMTLESGDLLSTGTPSGVGPLAPGDAIEISIGDTRGSALGTLRATVAVAAPR